MTSNTERIYPFQVLLPARQTGLHRDFKAQAEQVRSVAVERIGKRVGQLPASLITELDQALRIHLKPAGATRPQALPLWIFAVVALMSQES